MARPFLEPSAIFALDESAGTPGMRVPGLNLVQSDLRVT